jgi:hypothetical protein
MVQKIMKMMIEEIQRISRFITKENEDEKLV